MDLGSGVDQFAIGDHNIHNRRQGGTAFGSGNDRIIGGDDAPEDPFSRGDLLVGDSSVNAAPRTAVRDVISGRGGDDVIFGDNTNFDNNRTFGPAVGNDDLDGGDGVDTLRAGPGNDFLDGGPDAPDCSTRPSTVSKTAAARSTSLWAWSTLPRSTGSPPSTPTWPATPTAASNTPDRAPATARNGRSTR
ncbi:hypothetical protein OG905_38440 [Streptomyces sp. NBC_00322]|uniref:hypothetical protein n=1 Tax=Streptomyces sp. NBC_00322 TaxID=2975712 RepID=UPI002E2E5DD9|nr:hypothetical protein [Streptomyces sp. NBC_00322]